MRTRFRRYLKISRPKFWLYLVGPYFLGAVMGASTLQSFSSWRFWALFAWFTFPANLLLYGVNDVFDYDTDRHNPKKVTDEALVLPEERPHLLLTILILTVAVVPAILGAGLRVASAILLFLVLSIAYSAPPLRLKARPLLDSASNVLYLTPLLAGWWFFIDDKPAPTLVLSGLLWCAAMHAYSAIPDIEADRRAGLATIATIFGRDGTLLFCCLAYLATALLAAQQDLLAGLILSVYPLIMVTQLLTARSRVGRWYRYFPVLNGLAGMSLTLRFLWPLAR